MIESCSKQRMLLGIIFLGGLTVLVLVIESNWASGNGRSIQRVVEKNTSSADSCWLTENFVVIEECRPCSAQLQRNLRPTNGDIFMKFGGHAQNNIAARIHRLPEKGHVDLYTLCPAMSSIVMYFEIASKSNKVCSGTHFKESVNCEKSGKVFRSCERVTWLEEKIFWQFEGFMFAIGCFSTVTVYMRQRILDYRTLKRIHRQIANSV